ncbi:MAG: hypothetical protein R6T99_03900 [Bacteroidales bacterium]
MKNDVMKYLCCFFIIFLLIPCTLPAQQQNAFSHDREAYPGEIILLMEDVRNKTMKDQADDAVEEFSETWHAGYFNKEIREKIYRVSDVMLEKRMYPYPHFYQFIDCLNAFYSGRQSLESLNAWLLRLYDMGKQARFNNMSDFLEYSHALMRQNILNRMRNREWFFREGEYRFQYDTALVIVFEKLDLHCKTRNDSMVIRSASGVYHPDGTFWTGSGGRIFWTRVKLPPNEVYADLKDYEINTSQVRFAADSVAFYHKRYFDKPIMGVLEDMVSSSPVSKRSTFPRFESYFKDFHMENFFDGIHYEGGIGMKGARLIGSGGRRPALLEIVQPGQKNAVITSGEFVVTEKNIASEKAEFVIYYDADSLYHPKLHLKFDLEENELSLFQMSKKNHVPFYDSYHQIDIYAEAMYWKRDSGEISFQSLRSFNNQSSANFESDNYFSIQDYYTLQGLDAQNPLVVIDSYTRNFGTQTVRPALLAEFVKLPEEQVISMLLTLESRGFLVYDPDKREARVKDRLHDYLDAKAGRKDFDVMKFKSLTHLERNAIIDLRDFDITINGVKEIFLSDPQKVFIYPEDQQIVMKKDRDFTFTGRVKAGLFEFYSGECSFEYDTFKINLPSIDSLNFLVKRFKDDTLDHGPADAGYSRLPSLVRIRSVIEGLSGHIQIDKPDNKSGLVAYPDYPIFTSNSNAFVYYDSKHIREGAYTRDGFYFEMEPFTIDSLDDFSTDGIAFHGYLASAGIFPTLDKPLKVQDDYYLGFNIASPDTGYRIYEGKALFTDSIRLSGEGLTGKGSMEYLNSMSYADDFIFYPDSLTALASTMEMEPVSAEIEYPHVRGENIEELFLPGEDKLLCRHTADPFEIYGRAEFSGRIALSPDRAVGRGVFAFEKAMIESYLFAFGHHSMYADTSDFNLYTDTTFSRLAFLADDYQSHMDFDQRTGEFKSNGLSSLLEFPFNQYVCNMDGFRWDMDRNEMMLTNRVADIPNYQDLGQEALMDIDLTGSEFVSVHPGQDSLRFFSLNARYDVNDNIINAEDVKIIKVADAGIFPRDGKVTILKDAELETLTGADIIADTATKYHRMYGSNVNIYSSDRYVAKGYYDYVDRDGIPEMIKLHTITVDTNGRTYGLARLSDTVDFMLSPEFHFKGNATLFAPYEHLSFDGGFRVKQDCYNMPYAWVGFDTLVDPENVVLPVPKALYSLDGDPLDLSLNHSGNKNGYYPAFFERPWNAGDIQVASGHGNIRYDQGTHSYYIAPDSAVFDVPPAGQYFSLDTKNCKLKGRGPVDPGVDFSYLDLFAFGETEYFIIPDSLKLKLAAGINFFLDDQLLEMMADELQEANLLGIGLDNPIYKGAVEEMLGQKASDRILEEVSLYGAGRRIPQEMRYTLFFSDLTLIWDPGTSAFISRGDLGISSIDNTPINKYVKGHVSIEMRRTAPVFTMYIEISSQNWFFFSYRSNILQTISSHDRYNELLMNLKPERRTVKRDDEAEPYEFLISSKRKRIRFLRDMQEFLKK